MRFDVGGLRRPSQQLEIQPSFGPLPRNGHALIGSDVRPVAAVVADAVIRVHHASLRKFDALESFAEKLKEADRAAGQHSSIGRLS